MAKRPNHIILLLATAAALALPACRQATPRPSGTPEGTPAAEQPAIDPAATVAQAPAPDTTAPAPESTATTPAAAAPAQAPATTEQAGSLPTSININASAIADKVSAQMRPASPLVEGDAPVFAAGLPKHVRIAFGDDQLADDAVDMQQRQILIIPIADYLARFDGAAEAQKDLRGQIDTLKRILRRRSTRLADPVPVMPPVNAAQVFRSRVKYLKFNGGSGVRFLTAYVQDTMPLTSADLFYTFQGVSDDGKYYVSAFMPLRTAALTESQDKVESKEVDEAKNRFDAYLRRITTTLDRQKADGFAPNVDSLDTVIQSLQVRAAAEATPAAAEATTVPDVAATATVATVAPAGETPAGDAISGRTTTNVNVRATPNTRARILLRARRGATVQVLGRNAASDWLKVQIGRTTGWVSARYISGVTVESLAEVQ